MLPEIIVLYNSIYVALFRLQWRSIMKLLSPPRMVHIRSLHTETRTKKYSMIHHLVPGNEGAHCLQRKTIKATAFQAIYLKFFAGTVQDCKLRKHVEILATSGTCLVWTTVCMVTMVSTAPLEWVESVATSRGLSRTARRS